VSPAAVERIERIAQSGRLDSGDPRSRTSVLQNSRKDQTLNTPALATLFLTVHQIDWITATADWPWSAARCDPLGRAHLLMGRSQRIRDPVRGRCRSLARRGHDRPRTLRSAPTTVAKVLRSNGCARYRVLSQAGAATSCALALFPAIDPDDVLALTHCIDHVVAALA